MCPASRPPGPVLPDMPLPRPLANTGVRSPSYRSNGREMFSPRIVTQVCIITLSIMILGTGNI